MPTLGFLASLLLLLGPLFSQRIARGGTGAPLFVTSLITFLILFGMGVACVYAFAALALLDIGTQRERPLRVRSAV